jgi:hypothetical protein
VESDTQFTLAFHKVDSPSAEEVALLLVTHVWVRKSVHQARVEAGKLVSRDAVLAKTEIIDSKFHWKSYHQHRRW